MIGTLVGLILGLLIAFVSIEKGVPQNMNSMTSLILFFPAAIICIYFFIYSWALPPLQKAEQNSTPRILDMFKKDPMLGFNHLGLISFPLLAICLGFDANSIHFVPFPYLVGIWLLLLHQNRRCFGR